MKSNILKFKLLLLLILLSLTFSFNGCSDDDEPNNPIPEIKETYVPDDNFEKELIKLGYDDVLDDYVLTDKINDISGLDVSDLEIKDLTGIEDFESLTELYCSQNQLTSLDVSNNTSLYSLECQTNPLTCVKVNQTQLDNIPTDWEKDPEDTYSLDCN